DHAPNTSAARRRDAPTEPSASSGSDPTNAQPARPSIVRGAPGVGGASTTAGNGPAPDGSSRLTRSTLPCDTDEECRHVFLATASAQLSASLDPETTLQTIAGLAVPMFADWAAVDIVTADDQLRRVAAAQ